MSFLETEGAERSYSETETIIVDNFIRRFLRTSQKIAVIGISPDPSRPSRYVPEFLEEKGHVILPVHPVLEKIGKWNTKKNLEDVSDPTAVLIYLSNRNVDKAVMKAVQLRIPVIWLPLGVTTTLREKVKVEGITLIENRCPKIEWERLIGGVNQ